MTTARYHALMHGRRARLNRKELRRGYHFCADWDELLIGRSWPEYWTCGCVGHRRKPRFKVSHIDPLPF